MKGGFLQALNPSTYVSSPNASDAATYEPSVVGTFPQQMQASDSSAYTHSNALDYAKINPAIMQAAQSGASAMQSSSQNGGGRKQNNRQYQNQQQNQYQNQQQNQYQNQQQNQYQNQQQNQRGGVWNQMIGDAVAPLVLLGLQQYYGPRSKSIMHKKSYKGKMTKKYRK
jgi:TFIIF-interacting CTD phosphatase-like protein